MFLLNLLFDYLLNSCLQNPGIAFLREAEECDPQVVVKQPLVPLFLKRDYHPSLPIQRYRP